MLNGKGVWIVDIDSCEGGDVNVIANTALASGFTHVCVKIADGINSRNDANSKLNLKVALAANGIAMWGWHYIYGNDPATEAALAINETNNLNLAGYILDAEDEYEGKDPQATQFMTALRAGIAGIDIALSSHRYPQAHPLIPWAELLAGCTVAMPQVYWIQSHDPAAQLAQSIGQYQAITQAPIVPSGPMFDENGWGPTAGELTQFLTAAKATQLAANLFDWDAGRANADWWNAVSGFAW